MKTFAAMMLAGAFLISQPAFAGRTVGTGSPTRIAKTDKTDKKDKAADKADKKEDKAEKKEEKKAEKGGW